MEIPISVSESGHFQSGQSAVGRFQSNKLLLRFIMLMNLNPERSVSGVLRYEYGNQRENRVRS